jgi:hypothetical protein
VTPPPEASGELGVLLELAKVLGTGGATTLAFLAWQALRHERASRRDDLRVRADRQRELDGRLERIATTLARIDERTSYLMGGGGEETAPGRVRKRTPVVGVRTSTRKPTESDE